MAWTIADYRTQYAFADGFCQEVQSYRNQAGIPAMNELRNAGHHFLKAVDDGGSLKDQLELDNALGHARRAIYEATEAGIVTTLASVKKFKADYSNVQVADIIPGYVANLVDCQSAQKLLEIGRQNTFDRAQDHQVRIETFRKLRTFVELLDISRDDLNKKVSRDRTDSRRFLITAILAVLAVVVAVTFGVWSLYGNKRFWETPPTQTTAVTAPTVHRIATHPPAIP